MTKLSDCGADLTSAHLEEFKRLLLDASYSRPMCTLICSGCGKPMMDPGVVLPFDCPHCGMTITERRLVG